MLKPVPAGEGGSVGSKHTSLAPGTQHGDTMDFDMDTDMIRIQNEDRSSNYVLNVMDGHLCLQSTDLRQYAIQNLPGA